MKKAGVRARNCFFALILLLLILTVGLSGVFTRSQLIAHAAESIFIDSQSDYDTFFDTYSGKTNSLSGVAVIVNTDLDFSKKSFNMSTFAGNWEGNGHKIYNASKILFDTLAVNGSIKNVDFVDISNPTVHYLLVKTNRGIIENINFWGNFNTSANAGIPAVGFFGTVQDNYGVISSVSFFGTLGIYNNSSVSACYNNRAGGRIENTFMFTDIKVSNGSLTVQFPAIINNGATAGNAFCADVTGAHSVVSAGDGSFDAAAALSGNGITGDPFLIRNIKELAILRRINMPVIYAKLLADINVLHLPPLTSVTAREIRMDMSNCEFLYADGDVFGEGFDLIQTNAYYEGTDFSFSGQTLNSVTGVVPVQGSGTRENPYVITEIANLVYLGENGDSGCYAVLRNDILVNDGTDFYKTEIETLDINLNGCGYSIIGLINQPLALENTGNVKNLTVKSYFDVSGVSLFERNGGAVEKIKILSNAEMLGENTGTVKSSYILGADIAAGEIDGISGSFSKTAEGYTVYENGETYYYDALDNVTVKKYASFDTSYVFGYLHGVEECPVFKTAGAVYKAESNGLANYALNAVYKEPVPGEDSGTWIVAPYFVGNIQNNISTIIGGNYSYEWKYNGAPFSGEYFSDVGTYTLDAYFSGDDTLLSCGRNYTFTITQADKPTGYTVTIPNFSDTSIDYTGYAPVLPVPVLPSLEYGYSWAPLSASNNGLVYTQTATASSLNYKSFSISRKVTVKKAALTVTLSDTTADYLATADFSGITASLEGLLGNDDGKTLNELLGEDFHNLLTTDYAAGTSGTGDYEINLTLTLEYYNVTVKKGTLKILPIQLLQGGIVFSNVTVDYDGSAHSIYASNLPAGVTVKGYTGNGAIQSGTHNIGVTLSKTNYKDLVLTATLTISKISLILTANDVSILIGQTPSDFSFTAEGLVSTDSESVIGDGFNVSFAIYDGATLIEDLSALAAKTYKIKITVTQKPLVQVNYSITATDGVLTVEKKFLTAVVANNITVPDATYNGGDKSIDISNKFNGLSASFDYIYKVGGEETTQIIDAETYSVTVTVTPTGATANIYKETVYNLTLKIKKAGTSLAFNNTSPFKFGYKSGSYADSQNFINYVEGDVPVPFTSLSFVFKKNADVSECKNAGTYTVRVSFAGNRNYEACYAETTFEITQKLITLSFRVSYPFAGGVSSITPELTSVTGALNSEITVGALSFRFTDDITPYNAGNYSFTVTVNNGNYYHTHGAFNMTVTPIAVKVSLGELRYTYGTAGAKTINSVNYHIGTLSVTRYNYNEVLDFTVQGNFKNAGTYNLTDANLVSVTNYLFTFESGVQRIVIERKELSASWRNKGIAMLGVSSGFTYDGVRHDYDYEYVLSGFEYTDKQSDLNLSKVITNAQGTDIDILHVGSYSVRAVLTDALNYYIALDSITLSVTVSRAPLNAVIGNSNIYQGDVFSSVSATLNGLKGKDTGVSILNLDGSNVQTNPAIGTVISSNAGTVLPITMTATFRNYTLESVTAGSLTVMSSPYADYKLTDRTTTFSNTPVTVTIANVPSEVSVIYYNNVHTVAGTYEVTATISYPGGRVRYTSCTLTIFKATPQIVLGQTAVAFISGAPDNSYITGTAKLSNGQNVAGAFSFSAGQTLIAGTRNYDVEFIPVDTDNVNTATAQITINAVEVNFLNFVFDDPAQISFLDESLSAAEIYETVYLTLYPPISNLVMYKNGSETAQIVFDKTETVEVSIKWKGSIVFEHVFMIELKSVPQTIYINETMLSLSGITLSGNTMKVETGGGRIKMREEYSLDYVLFVNGIKVESDHVINGREGDLVLSIRRESDATSANPLWAVSYTVKVEDVEPPKTVNPDTTKIIIIVASTVGGSGLIFAAIFVIKKIRERKARNKPEFFGK